MSVSEALQFWMKPLATRDDNHHFSTPHSTTPQTGQVADSENIAPTPSPTAKKRKQVSAVVDVDEMAREGFSCCNGLRCVESFDNGKGDIKTLRAEQAAMVSLTGAGRSHFIHTKIPLVSPGRNKGAMVAGRQLVCTAFIRRAFNVSNNMIQALKSNPGSPSLKGNKRARFGTASPSKNACLGYIDHFAEPYGQLMPHENATYLYLGSMKKLYDDFAEERRLAGEDTIGYPYFTKIWNKYRCTIKPKSGGMFIKCLVCTRFKETCFGAPGIRATKDPVIRAASKTGHVMHLKDIELDRGCLLRDEQRAMEAKSNRHPLRFVSIQADAAAHIAFMLPMQSPVTHGTDRGYGERQKIMAVLVQGQFMEVFLTPQNLGGGYNLICTALHHTFNRLFEEHVPAGTHPFIDHVTCQVDNCGFENKNYILIGYFGSLVGRRIIGSVSVQFMPVGHTHIKIDQAFSRLSTGCKHRNLFTREEQADAFSASYKTLPVHTTTLRSLGNFKGVILGGVRKIHGISKPRAFQLVRDGEQQVKVGMKEFMHHEAFTGMTRDGVFTGQPHELFLGSVPRVEDAPPFVFKAVDEAIFSKFQQRYDSVHSRLNSLYPDDPAKRAHIIRQMNLSVQRLRENGTKEWSLPSFDKRPYDNYHSDDDTSDDDTSDSRGSNNDSALDNALQQSLPVVEGGGGGARSSLHLKPGWFVVFPLELSNPCSLVVGKIVSMDLSGGNEGEVTVHWYTPARKRKSRRAKYGRGVWSQGFVLEGNRQIPDEGTESVDSACFTFPSLLQSRKLPTVVWAAVEDSIPTSSLEEEDSNNEDEDDAEDGGRGAGVAAHSNMLRLPSPPTAPSSPSPAAPCPAPPANLRLTLAHFRPRRGQHMEN